MLRQISMATPLTVPCDAGEWALSVTDPGSARWLSALRQVDLGVIPCGWHPIAPPPRLCAGLEFTGNGTLYLLQGIRPVGPCADASWLSEPYDLRGLFSGVIKIHITDRVGDSTGLLTAEASADCATWDRVTGFPDGVLRIGPKVDDVAPLYPVGLKRFIRFKYTPEMVYGWGFQFTLDVVLRGRHES
jgi:hypothetical protein